ncbi:hypothetical protein ACFE04_012012 [Oxalis oulophora]
MAMNNELVDANTKAEKSAVSCFEERNLLCQVEQGLFVGSYADANNKDALKSSNVTHILTVATIKGSPFPNDFTYKIIEVMDIGSTNLAQYFDECFEFIEGAKRSGGGVLVHCFMGISRSVTVVVAYLMKKHGMSMSQALEIVKTKRPQAAPNHGFMTQLLLLEKSLQGPT